MVDALEPAAEAMKACAEKGDLSAMLAQAAEAARQGMENTKNYQAKYGRAKSLMERAMGHQDAGAHLHLDHLPLHERVCGKTVIEVNDMPKKILNVPENCVAEAMEGFLAAHKEYVQVEDVSAMRVKNLKDKPAVIVGGGSGHEPMFAYFIGDNLADASVAGSVFTSPDPGSILQAATRRGPGQGRYVRLWQLLRRQHEL